MSSPALSEVTETDLEPPDSPDNFTTLPAPPPAASSLPSGDASLLAVHVPKAPSLPRDLDVF